MWELKPNKYMSRSEVTDLRRVTEEKATIDLAKGRTTWPKVWMLVDLACQTGMRVGELVMVKVSDLNLKRDPFVHVIGKGGKARDIFIGSFLVRHIKSYILSQGLKPDSYLLNTSGRQLTRMGAQQQFKRACKAAGLPGHYSIHSARHTFGTLLYAKHKDLRLVQKLLGHADPATTAVYADSTKEDALEAVNGLFDD